MNEALNTQILPASLRSLICLCGILFLVELSIYWLSSKIVAVVSVVITFFRMFESVFTVSIGIPSMTMRSCTYSVVSLSTIWPYTSHVQIVIEFHVKFHLSASWSTVRLWFWRITWPTKLTMVSYHAVTDLTTRSCSQHFCSCLNLWYQWYILWHIFRMIELLDHLIFFLLAPFNADVNNGTLLQLCHIDGDDGFHLVKTF